MGGVLQGVDRLTREPIDASGGWVDVWYDWTPKTHSHVGYSIDDPDDKDLTSGRSYNQFIFGNVTYDVTKEFAGGGSEPVDDVVGRPERWGHGTGGSAGAVYVLRVGIGDWLGFGFRFGGRGRGGQRGRRGPPQRKLSSALTKTPDPFFSPSSLLIVLPPHNAETFPDGQRFLVKAFGACAAPRILAREIPSKRGYKESLLPGAPFRIAKRPFTDPAMCNLVGGLGFVDNLGDKTGHVT